MYFCKECGLYWYYKGENRGGKKWTYMDPRNVVSTTIREEKLCPRHL